MGVENGAQTFELNACNNTFINITEKRFENPGPFATCFGSFQVFKYEDQDHQGDYDEGEPGLENWSFIIYDDQGNQVDTLTTDQNGLAEIELEEGDYTVCEILTSQPNWANTDPGTVDGTYNTPCKPVSITSNGGSGGTPGPASVEIALNDDKDTRFLIEFVSNVGPTWTYRVTEIKGRDLSHWSLIDLDACVSKVIDSSPQATLGQDGSTNTFGIKWDVDESFTTGLISFTLDDTYPAEPFKP